MRNAIVSIVMGSDSDLPVMIKAKEILDEFGIPNEVSVVSAHRTPERLMEFSKTAHERGIKVIIGGAGGAAHLPGMVASISPLPVIGVPIKSSNSIDGWDSILSILQMPEGVTVGTVGLNNAKNAGLLAAEMLSVASTELRDKLLAYKQDLKDKVMVKVANVEAQTSSQ